MRLFYEKPAALQELSTDEHAIIAASAGTGKTYTLQHLVVELLLDDRQVRLDEILLVTFTVAATSDLKAKIRATLQLLVESWETARSLEEPAVELSADGTLQPADEVDEQTHWIIDADGIGRLRHGLRNFDRAAIYTIHGFCQRILVEHAFANRRLFEQEHVSDEDAIAEGFAEMLRHDVRPGTEHQKWLTAYLGAGNDIDDLREKLTGYVQCRGEYRPVETVDLEAFDQFCKRLVPLLEGLDWEAWKEEIKPLAQNADGTSARQSNAIGKRVGKLVDNFVPRFDPDDPVANLFVFNDAFKNRKEIKYFAKDKSQVVLDLVGELGDALRGIEQFAKNCELIVISRLGETLKRRVETLKQREGYFTFNDMVRLVRDTLCDKEADTQLLESIRSQFRYGLIDEFQDTDRDQWDIFRRVFVDSPAEDRHFLYLIGDPKQAIYGFRGGDVYTYLEACTDLEDLGADRVSLRHNYRSTEPVLDACNRIFDADAEEPVQLGEGIEYEQEGVQPGLPWLCLRRGGDPVDAGVTAVELTTERESLGIDQVRWGLLEYYADEIADIVHGRQDLEFRSEDGDGDDCYEPVGAEDIFVLSRKRKQLDNMARLLRRRGVPFAFLKLPGLFQTPEAEDIYDLLLALDSPFDRSRRARAWMTPFFDLELTDLEGLVDVENSDEVFARLLGWSRASRTTDFASLFDRIVDESGLIRRRLLLERGERELTNYLHIFELLADEASRQIRTVEELARRLKRFIDGTASPEAEEAEQQRLETEQKAVQLLTIHGAKGLERGLVFVVPALGGIEKMRKPFRFHTDADDDSQRKKLVEWHDNYGNMRWPDKKQYESAALAEELRLAYVAITRAELMAYVPYATEDSTVYDKLSTESATFLQIIDRTTQLRQAGEADVFEFHTTSIDRRRRGASREEVEASLHDLRDFQLDADRVGPDPEKLREVHRQLLKRRWEVTSFSKMKQRGRTAHNEDEKADDDTEPRPNQVLAGGMATGNFLHQVLEDLEYGLVDDYTADEWVNDERVREFFEARARRFGRFDDAAVDEAMSLVYDTLRAPVALAGSELATGVRGLDESRVRREIEFLFPAPEQHNGAWRRAFADGAQVRGGFVTGVVDLLFEQDGKIYFADWKSDQAHPYDDDALAGIVEERYANQANIYSLAVCRMIGVETPEEYDQRFGGYFYFFVRGMSPDAEGRGIYSGKVDFKDLVGFEETLADTVAEAKL